MVTSCSPRFDTLAVHGGMEGLRESGAHVPPIDFSTTNPLPGIEDGGASYENLATGGALGLGDSAVYQRLWNPGVARFEDALAALEGAPAAVAFSSGMAAMAACVIASVSAGRPHVVAVRPAYGGTDHLLSHGLLGSTVTWTTADQVAAAITPQTGFVLVETPANPTLELTDIAAVVAQAGTVPVMVDNTFATPVLQRPLAHGAAMVLHSATKYLGGHGDVMGGVIAASEDWVARLRQVRAVTGALLHPMAAYLLHRGLRTLPVRMRAQQAAANTVAVRLQHHRAVERVMYPALPGQDPGGVLGRQMAGAGAILSIDLVGGYQAATRFIGACRLTTHAVSLGGVDTLVQHPASLTHRPVPPARRPGAGIVRLSIGLEDTDDIVDDIARALDAAAAEPTAPARTTAALVMAP